MKSKGKEVKIVINDYKYKESDKTSFFLKNKSLIFLLVFLLLVAFILFIVYMILNRKEEEKPVEKPAPVEKEKIYDSEIRAIIRRYSMLDNCQHNEIESFILNNSPLDIRKDYDERIANLVTSNVLNNYFQENETVSLADVKTKALELYDLPDSFTLGTNTWVQDFEGDTGCSKFSYDSSSGVYRKDTTEDRIYSTDYCVSECTYYGEEPYVKLVDNELKDDTLTLNYKAIYVGLSSDNQLAIYKDPYKKEKIGTSYAIAYISDKDFNKGQDIHITFKKVNDNYVFVKSEYIK